MAVSSFCLAGCAEYSQTTRLFNGREVTGRPVSAPAYARYLEGARQEALGNDAQAIAEFRRALDYDSHSVEIQTRIAHLICKKTYIEGSEAFEQAAELDPLYEPVWRLRARCALAHDDAGQALTWAREALRVAPLEFSSTQVLVEVLQALEQHGEALRLLLGYLARFPEKRRAWVMLRDLSEQTNNAAWHHAALNELTEAAIKKRWQPVPHHLDAERSAEEAEDLGYRKLDRILIGGDLGAARHLATALRVSPLELGIRALELGRPALALKQGLVVLGAAPQNSDARILVLAAAAAAGDDDAFEWALSPRQPAPELPSSAAAQQLAILLAERVDEDAAKEWLEAFDRTQLATLEHDLPAGQPDASEQPGSDALPLTSPPTGPEKGSP